VFLQNWMAVEEEGVSEWEEEDAAGYVLMQDEDLRNF